jgi:hypothetical protein
VLTRPVFGLALGGGVLVILVVRHLRWLLTLTALGLVASTAVYTVMHQATFRFPAGGWPINFEPASELAWAAVVLLAADAIVEVARGGALRPALPQQGDNETGAEPEPETHEATAQVTEEEATPEPETGAPTAQVTEEEATPEPETEPPTAQVTDEEATPAEPETEGPTAQVTEEEATPEPETEPPTTNA